MGIVIQGLEKSYGDFKAVCGIDFEVLDGELFAFLGPNGAGKSTTINIIATLLTKSAGAVFVDGVDIDKDPTAIRSALGIVFQNSLLDGRLSVYDNLKIRANCYGLSKEAFAKRLEFLSKNIDLGNLLKRPYGKLSGGQKRRVDICRALIHTPKILILDEPTTGLDPQTRESVWQFIAKIRKEEGLTVLLTTHYMEETEKADRVAIIDEGKIVATGTPYSLKKEYSFDKLKLYAEDSSAIVAYLQEGNIAYTKILDGIEVRVDRKQDALKILSDIGDKCDNFEMKKGDMDSVFINITGKKIRE